MPSTRGQWNTNTFTPVPIPPLSSLEKKMINWKQTCCRKLVGNKILSLFSPFALLQLYLFSRRKPKRNRNILVSRGSKIEAVKDETAANGEGWILTVWSNLLARDFIKNKRKGTKSFLITLFYSQNSENIHFFFKILITVIVNLRA